MLLTPLVLKKLSKNFGKESAVSDVSFEVKKGEIFGFLGPNGAGKTTTIRSIMNFLQPSSGEVLVMGMDSVKDSVAIKKDVGYLAGDLELYENLTGQQYCNFIANLRKVKNSSSKIKQLANELQASMNRPIGTLSRGNIQKIALLSALAPDPELLILDEPTTGLDPLMQNRFYDILRRRAKQGKTVFMSSHILSEVQEVCDRVAFMKEGRLIKIINVRSLVDQNKKEVHLTVARGKKIMKLPDFDKLKILDRSKDSLRFTTSQTSKELLKWLSFQPIEDVTIQDLSLEDVFLELYGHKESGSRFKNV